MLLIIFWQYFHHLCLTWSLAAAGFSYLSYCTYISFFFYNILTPRLISSISFDSHKSYNSYLCILLHASWIWSSNVKCISKTSSGRLSVLTVRSVDWKIGLKVNRRKWTETLKLENVICSTLTILLNSHHALITSNKKI